MKKWHFIPLAGVSLLVIFLVNVRFVINTSASLPHWVFLEIPQAPQRGDLAVFMPPDTALYKCPFIKQVRGLPGDEIEHQGACFYLIKHNSKTREFLGCAKPQTQDGYRLEATSAGIIPDGYVWFHTDHPNSYDSRYTDIGLIPETAITGRALALGGEEPPAWLVRLGEHFGEGKPPACPRRLPEKTGEGSS